MIDPLRSRQLLAARLRVIDDRSLLARGSLQP
jgi:hypothetical protein